LMAIYKFLRKVPLSINVLSFDKSIEKNCINN